MEKYIKYLKDKKVIFGLIVVVLLILNSCKTCGVDCDHDHHECEDDHIEHACEASCDSCE